MSIYDKVLEGVQGNSLLAMPPGRGTPAERAAAIRTLAASAHDGAELTAWCEMLGLDPTEARGGAS